MGRFAWKDEIDEDDAHWEFVASDPSEQEALVVREEVGPDEAFPDPVTSSSVHLQASGHLNQYFPDQAGSAYRHYPEDPPPKQYSLWKRSIFMVFVACLIHKYLPPAPPDATATWNEFITKHSTRLLESTTALAIDTPLHLGQWCWTGLSTDLTLAYEKYWVQQQQPAPTCVVRRSTAMPAKEESLDIIGQDTAVRLALNAIQTWQVQQKNKDALSPLLFFWTGFSSVGKSTLAHSLARNVLFDCNSDDLPILEIISQDYSAETKAIRVDLIHRIVRHVQRYPEGNIILIKGIEDLPSEEFVWLIRTLSSWSNSFSSATTDAKPDSLPEEEDPLESWQQYNCCTNTVFVLTSTLVGRNVITRTLRQAEALSPYDASFLADLSHEIDLYFEDQFHSRQVFNAIVPFGPLTREHLVKILELRVAQIRPDLSITSAAVEALLDPSRVEYLEWRKRSSKDDKSPSVLFMTVAMDGAQVLDERNSPLWQQLLAQVHQCFVVSEDEEEGDSKNAVIDFKWDKILLKWCASDDRCQEVCRFSI